MGLPFQGIKAKFGQALSSLARPVAQPVRAIFGAALQKRKRLKDAQMILEELHGDDEETINKRLTMLKGLKGKAFHSALADLNVELMNRDAEDVVDYDPTQDFVPGRYTLY